MKRIGLTSILIVLFIMTSDKVHAHSDWYFRKSFGNVKTSILTGFQYEEINKITIFGQLAEKLSKELKYSGPVLLDFKHTYTRNTEPEFFISYDSITSWDTTSKEWIKEKGIVVKQFGRHFQGETTLKLLEYAISNVKNIISSQQKITSHRNRRKMGFYGIDSAKIERQLDFYSIDTLQVQKALDKTNSKLLNSLLQQKVYRPEDEKFIEGITYYWQNDRYFLFMKYWDDSIKHNPAHILFDIENVYDFHRFKNWSTIVFDTDSSFYGIKQSASHRLGSGTSTSEHKPQISQRQVIDNTYGYIQPFHVENIGGDRVSINFEYYGRGPGRQPRDRILIYLFDEDELIQDLDELLKKR